MNDPIKEESKLTYDDRRKVLIQEKKQVMENIKLEKGKDGKEVEVLYSTVISSMNVEYQVPGIKVSIDGLKNTEANLKAVILNTQDKIKESKETIEKDDLPEMPEELKEIKAKLEELSKYAGLDKLKDELGKSEEDLKEMRKELIKTEKDIKEIKDTIGTRLEL